MIVCYITGPGSYFNYLTNWGNVMVSITFITLSFGHYYEGHLCLKRRESEYSDQSPNFWKWATFLYECCVVMIFEITACFWLVVFPFMVTEEPKDAHVPYNDELLRKRKIRIITTFIAIGFAHLLPFIAVVTDFRRSAVKFYAKHFLLIFIFSILYLSYHLFQTFYLRGPNEEPIYPSHDWRHHPVRSSLLTILCLLILSLIYQLLVRVSEMKIRNQFPGG